MVILFVINGVITITTLNNIQNLSKDLAEKIDPSLESIIDFRKMLIESKSFTTNWVFLRFADEDKRSLENLHALEYPALKARIKVYSSKWENKKWADSLNKLFAGFEQLLVIEKSIMENLKEFKDYDDPITKFEAERKVEEDVLPQTAILYSSLNTIRNYWLSVRNEKIQQAKHSSMQLRWLIIALVITIIGMGIFLSVYMARKIINPINKIRDIINDLGKGITRKVNYKIHNDEIGGMVLSVNNLAEKLQSTAAFATEIGKRKFTTRFEPLSNDDSLGIALVAMRDNIKQSDEKLNEAQHIAHIGSWERIIKTDKITLSDEMFHIFDIDPETFDFQFKSIMDFIHCEDRDSIMEVSKKNLSRPPVPYECRIVTSKGILKNVFVQTKSVHGKHGETVKTFGIVQDITERKQAEEKITAEKELFRVMIESMPDQIYLKDASCRFLLCNMPVALNAGLQSQQEMIGKTDFDFFTAENANSFFKKEQHLIESGESIINYEQHTIDNVTGKIHWSLTTKVPFKNAAGEIIGLIGINRDITDRKISEKKIEDANRELTILFNSIDEVFFSVDMVNLKVIQISRSCEKLYGYLPSDFTANYKLWFDLIHPDDRHIVEKENDMMQNGELINNQYRIINKDNTIHWVETKITSTLDETGKLVRVDGVTRDITERKDAEKKLEGSFSILEATIESTADGILVADFNGKIVRFNKKFVELWGIPEEVLNTHDDKKAIAFVLDQLTNPDEFVFKVNELYVHRDAVSSDILRFKDGRTFERHSQPQLINGNCVGRVWNFRDITKRKHDEEMLQKSQASLVINNFKLEQKNKELEQFAYVASHDLQEPLRTTISFVEILRQQYYGRLDAKGDKYLDYIMQASDRMRVLITDLLDFSRIGYNKDVEQVDCNTILKNVIADIDKAITESNAKIKSEDLPVLSGYATELKQLFQNLIINSIKFKKRNLVPEINISVQRKKDYWQFAFTDNGIGIDQQYSERIFIIFQRLHTRAEYKGSGIGLSHCKKIVELHHGKIWVESIPDEGSTFYFTIHSPKEKTNDYKTELHNAN